MLFPAEKKHALSYEGDMAVTEVFKFMADHGSNNQHLVSAEGKSTSGAVILLLRCLVSLDRGILYNFYSLLSPLNMLGSQWQCYHEIFFFYIIQFKYYKFFNSYLFLV